jgi:hypothetical protein
LAIFALVFSLQILLSAGQPSTLTSAIIPNPNCLSNDSQGTCTLCSIGYFLNNGYCYPVNPNCADYSMNNGTCLSCPSNAILESPLCIIINPTCADGSTSVCTSCSSDYVPLSGFCVLLSTF